MQNDLRRRAPHAGLDLLETLRLGLEAAQASGALAPDRAAAAAAWLERARRRFSEEDDDGNSALATWTARICDALLAGGELDGVVAIGIDDCVAAIEHMVCSRDELLRRNTALRQAVADAYQVMGWVKSRVPRRRAPMFKVAFEELRELCDDHALVWTPAGDAGHDAPLIPVTRWSPTALRALTALLPFATRADEYSAREDDAAAACRVGELRGAKQIFDELRGDNRLAVVVTGDIDAETVGRIRLRLDEELTGRRPRQRAFFDLEFAAAAAAPEAGASGAAGEAAPEVPAAPDDDIEF